MAITVRLLLVAAAAGFAAWDVLYPRSRARPSVWFVLALALGEIGFAIALWLRHRDFPLHLELMEGAVLGHVERLLEGAPLYPAPSAGFVPFAYNPLYYVACAPLVALFGAELPVLRGLSIVGALASGALVLTAVARRTGSRWRALVGVGLFAAAYEAMDAYLDTAHGDSWLLAAILGGTALLESGLGEVRRAPPRPGGGGSRALRLVGVGVLCAAFWIKQHGAVFALAGVAYVVLRRGVRGAGPELALAVVAGPLAYAFVGPVLFGPALHLYTWTVPRSWSSLDAATFGRVAGYLARYLPLLAAALVTGWLAVLRRGPRSVDVWQWMAAVALGSGFMGALDAGGNDNVFIPLATFVVVVGASELARLAVHPARWWRAAEPLVLAVSFAPLLYDPRHVWTPSTSAAAYADLTATVAALPGPVFAPDLGPTDGVTRFTPPFTWVAIEDLVRGPRGPAVPRGVLAELLAPVADRAPPAFILTGRPLASRPSLADLGDRYRLVADYGTRFAALRTQPMRCGRLYPRYLYERVPEGAAVTDAGAQAGRNIPAERNHS